MKKIIFIIAAFLLVLVVGFFVYAKIMTIGNQRMSITETPLELKALEKQIQKETKDLDANFEPISYHEFKNCNIKLYIYIDIKDDNINFSEKNLYNYIKSITHRAKKHLFGQKCYKIIVIETSSENYKNLKDYNHHFEFQINP